jgi:beta-lactamase regulating signal transducer with metallopeptidase domain
MNGLELVLTWTLIHSLWIALAALLLSNLLSGFISKSATRRFIKISILTIFTSSVAYVFITQLDLLINYESAKIIGLRFIDANAATPNWLDEIKLWISSNSLVISSLWFMGIVIGTVKFIANRQRLNKYKSSALPCAKEQVINRVTGLAEDLGVRRKVQVVISAILNSPMAIGVLKPTIYLPAGLISGFSTEELDTILIHELSHIKRHDYFINLFLVFIETVFFFNPIVLHLVKDIRKEMEYVCDDEVLEWHNQIAYAKVLVKLQEINLSNQVALAAKNKQSQFKQRIERMINQNNKKVSPKLGVVVVLFISLLVSSAFAV